MRHRDCPRAQSRNDSLSRWTPRMAPAIPEAVWRKSSQWVALTRPHAMRAVEDTTVNGAIQRHCRYGWDAHLRRCACPRGFPGLAYQVM